MRQAGCLRRRTLVNQKQNAKSKMCKRLPDEQRGRRGIVEKYVDQSRKREREAFEVTGAKKPRSNHKARVTRKMLELVKI